MSAEVPNTFYDQVPVSTERVRGLATGGDGMPVTPMQFDRWLAAHDAEIREQVAAPIRRLAETYRDAEVIGVKTAGSVAEILEWALRCVDLGVTP